jgi:hypothetical protein
MSDPIEKNTHFGPENHVFSIASSGWKKAVGMIRSDGRSRQQLKRATLEVLKKIPEEAVASCRIRTRRGSIFEAKKG